MPTVKSLTSLIQQKYNRLDTVPNNLYSKVGAAEKQVYSEILIFMGGLERDGDGFLLQSPANKKAMQGLAVKIRQVFDQSDYIDAVGAFAGEYQGQMDINSAYFRRVFPDFNKPSAWAVDIVQQNRNAVVNSLINTTADAEYIQPLTRAVEDAVLSGASFTEAIDQVASIAITSPDRESKLLRYSKQIAHDAFAITDRTYTNQLGKDMGVEWYRYSGGTINETRQFCARRSNQFYPKKEVETWPASREEWSGKFVPTTSTNIFNVAGGYNCRHSLLPVSVISVPKSRVEQAMREGYYQPDQKTRDRLGIKETTTAEPPPVAPPDPGTNVKRIPTPKPLKRATVAEAKSLNKVSQTFGPQLDEIAQKVAKDNGGTVTPINYKKVDRIVEKANKEYGGDIAKVKDAVRNTIVVEKQSQFKKVIKEIQDTGIVHKVKIFENDALGYEGVLISVKNKEGVWGEIQLNIPELIYAKEKPADASFILGKSRFEAIKKKFGAEGGLGHKYYEKYRTLNTDLEDATFTKIFMEQESQAYYNIFKPPGPSAYRKQFDLTNVSKKVNKLADDPERYFTAPPGTVRVKVSNLVPTKIRQDGVVRANKLMEEVYNGTKPKREPLSLRKIGDKYLVIDGNATAANAEISGWDYVYAILE